MSRLVCFSPMWRQASEGKVRGAFLVLFSALTSQLDCGVFFKVRRGGGWQSIWWWSFCAKSLNVWAPVKPGTSKAHHHQPGASCATWQPGGPCQKWPLWEGPSISFLIHSASVHYSPQLKEAECPPVAPDKPFFLSRSRTFAWDRRAAGAWNWSDISKIWKRWGVF